MINIKTKTKLHGITFLFLGVGSLTCSAKSFFNNFNKNNGIFSVTNFINPNSKGGVEVDYKPQYFKRAGGSAQLRAGRKTKKRAYGVWFQTGFKFPNGTVTTARCKVFGSSFYNWAAFWTYYRASEAGAKGSGYYEHDVLETYPKGNFFNRYTVLNAKTNEVSIQPGELNELKGKAFRNWRKNWREYTVNWGAGCSTLSSKRGKDNFKKTICGKKRFKMNHKLVLQNRPWGPDIGKLKNWTDIGTLHCDFVNAFTP